MIGAGGVRRRFLLLRTLRWLPTGFLIPVMVLLLRERGFSLGEIGLITAAQGVVVLLLELPTGGLADALGRRPVLLLGTAFNIGAVALFVVADSMAALVAVFALQGVYRALESGPLDSWYVDAAQRADPDADIERGLAHGGVALGAAVGLGTLLSGGLVALGPVGGVEPLVLPLLASLALEVVHVTAIAALMTETRPGRGMGYLLSSVRETPHVVNMSVRLVGASGILIALVAVELLWGFGMTAFETYTPVRLADVIGGTERAAAVLGPVSAAAWLIAAAGAGAVPTLVRWAGAAYAGATMHIVQGLTVAAIALAAGPLGVIAAYLATMGVHGAANPVHQGLLHRAVEGPSRRATVVSASSLTAHSGNALGGICLGALADATSLTVAILAGAAVLAVAAPLYLVARTNPATNRSQPGTLAT